VLDKKVLEVGSLDVNGSLRHDIERAGAASYLGVDVVPGSGVDEICSINDLCERYVPRVSTFVITTELLEHVRDWRGGISNLKRVLRPNGVLLVTTRSKGFPYHGYPHDFWRYDVEDMKAIFSDLSLEVVERDPLSPGVFVKARRPMAFSENTLDRLALHSVVTNRRCLNVTDFDVLFRRLRHQVRLLLSRVLPPTVLAGLDRRFRKQLGNG